jgi:3-hydroxymyristoyl/3-hydroxydecanoyl-(acyl carrier protein) dehydratase
MQPPFELPDLLPWLPHRPPFLFVDRVRQLEPGQSIVAERLLRADEPHFAGHFPGRPIMPGVLIGEALAQTSGLLIGLSQAVSSAPAAAKPGNYVLAATNLKFTHVAVPGDTLILRSASDRNFGALWRFTVEAAVGDKVVASGSLTLALIGRPSIL